jgi:hypothetical protein
VVVSGNQVRNKVGRDKVKPKPKPNQNLSMHVVSISFFWYFNHMNVLLLKSKMKNYKLMLCFNLPHFSNLDIGMMAFSPVNLCSELHSTISLFPCVFHFSFCEIRIHVVSLHAEGPLWIL